MHPSFYSYFLLTFARALSRLRDRDVAVENFVLGKFAFKWRRTRAAIQLYRQRSLSVSNAERLKINPECDRFNGGTHHVPRPLYPPLSAAPSTASAHLGLQRNPPSITLRPHVPAPQQPLPLGTYVYRPSQKGWLTIIVVKRACGSLQLCSVIFPALGSSQFPGNPSKRVND